MARIPATSPRSSRNVRNGPSPFQSRLSGLLREARWIVFAALAAWLGLVLATWNASDPAWSHSVHAGVTQNRGGILGAHIADFLLFLFGYAAWLWVVLLAQRVAVGFYRLTSLLVPKLKSEALPRVHWEVAIGYVMLFVGVMGIEALQFRQLGANLPAGAGGQLGQLLAGFMSSSLGATGCTLLLLVFIAVGSSLFFGFSWLHLAERVGSLIERLVRRIMELRAAREDRKVGAAKKAERDEVVVAKQEELVHEQPVRIEPAMVAVPKAAQVLKEKPDAARPDAPRPDLVRPKATFTAPAAIEPAERGASGQGSAGLPSAGPRSVGSGSAGPRSADLPALDLLDMPVDNPETVSPETIEFTSRLIEKKLSDFGVRVVVVSAQAGPVITRYEIEPATGVKGSQIVNLAKDLARALSLVSIRVVETIPGKNLMGLELPNPRRQMVKLSEIIGSQTYHSSASMLTMALGKDIAGHPVVADLS